MARPRSFTDADPALGREARRPTDIPRQGWGRIAHRVKTSVGEDDLSMIAGGVAFYAFLALIPALAALVSLYGLISSPDEVTRQMQAVNQVVPPGAQDLLQQQLQRLAGQSGGALGVSMVIGVLLALWSANKGTKALIKALNVAYGEHEDRCFLALNALSLGLTALGVVTGVVALLLIGAVPALLGSLGLGEALQWLVSLARWPLLALLAGAVIAVFYRTGPSRRPARWAWVMPGAAVAVLLWLIGSLGFSLYVAWFGSYGETYGALGAVAVLLLWLLLSSYAVLLGAEVNCEAERQTRHDTTHGREAPLGRRGARAADEVDYG